MIYLRLSRSQYAYVTLSAFLDIQGAFNNVIISSIENSLRVVHPQDFLVRFITHMLGNRLIRLNLSVCSIVRRATRSTPQDNVSLRRLENRGFKVVAYAYDVVILVSGKFLSMLGDLILSALGASSSWAMNCLGIISKKTNLISHISKKFKPSGYRS